MLFSLNATFKTPVFLNTNELLWCYRAPEREALVVYNNEELNYTLYTTAETTNYEDFDDVWRAFRAYVTS